MVELPSCARRATSVLLIDEFAELRSAYYIGCVVERSTFIVDRRGRHRSTMKVDRSM